MFTFRKSALLVAVPLWAAGCGSTPAPGPAPSATAQIPHTPRPGHTMSCPPPPPPGSTYKGMICAEAPEPCSPQPCAGPPGHRLYITAVEPWTAPDGGPGYRLHWKISRGPGKTLHLTEVELRDRGGARIVRYRGPAGEGCGNRHGVVRIPADRTTESHAPICLRTTRGKQPVEATFHFWIENTGGGQTVIEVPLTADARGR